MNTAPSTESELSVRGVFEDGHRVNGAPTYTLVSLAGKCLVRAEVAPDMADKVEPELWRLLELLDPTTLRIIA